MEDTLKQLKNAVTSLLQLQLQQRNSTETTTKVKQVLSETEIFNQLNSFIEKYTYNTAEGIRPFHKWLKRHEYTITEEASKLPEEMKKHLIGKLGQIEFDRLTDHVAPRDSRWNRLR